MKSLFLILLLYSFDKSLSLFPEDSELNDYKVSPLSNDFFSYFKLNISRIKHFLWNALNVHL